MAIHRKVWGGDIVSPWLIRLLLALFLPVMAGAQAQLSKPDALPPALGAPVQLQAGGKPPPLPPAGGDVAPRSSGAARNDGRAGAPQGSGQGNGQSAPRC